MICIKQEQRYLDFLNSKLESGLEYPKCVSFAKLDDSGDILAVVAYYNFSKFSCDAAVASVNPRACTKDFIDVCFHYAFITAKRSRITCIASVDNRSSLRLIRGLGFREEGRLKGMFGDQDGVIFGITKTECKWLRS